MGSLEWLVATKCLERLGVSGGCEVLALTAVAG